MGPIRSLLFAPGNRPDLIQKFIRYQSDAYAIDLEDATPAADKAAARASLPRIVAQLREQALAGMLLVRTNETASAHFDDDLAAALGTAIDGVMLPKLTSVDDLSRVDTPIGRAEQRSGRAIGIIGLIETAAGVMNVERLATSGSRLSALAFGAEDFVTDIGGVRTPEGLEVLYARSRVVLAAKAARLATLDQVFVNLRDDEGFARDATFGRQLGYDGKLCILPRQVDIANRIFAPSAEEIARSRQLVDVYTKAKAAGRGSIDYEGGMIDEPMLKRAEAVLQLAERLGLSS